MALTSRSSPSAPKIRHSLWLAVGGRYAVVEILLSRSSKEHRNVSDYTPLSLAASGGYTNIIKLLLSHGAEINSRSGSLP